MLEGGSGARENVWWEERAITLSTFLTLWVMLLVYTKLLETRLIWHLSFYLCGLCVLHKPQDLLNPQNV